MASFSNFPKGSLGEILGKGFEKIVKGSFSGQRLHKEGI
jgi:hypothetical protein